MLADGRLAIVDERDHTMTIVSLDDSTQALNIKDFTQYDLGPSANQNKAFEAIAWDPRNQRLVLGEERPPRLFTWRTDGRSPLTGDKQPLPSDELDLRNLSALGSTRVPGTCWCCRPTRTCCWSWTSGASRSAS